MCESVHFPSRLDKFLLQPGVPWEIGFCNGLVLSRMCVPIISRRAIHNKTSARSDWSLLTNSSSVDNVLLEHRLAIEFEERGLLQSIFAVYVGDLEPSVVVQSADSGKWKKSIGSTMRGISRGASKVALTVNDTLQSYSDFFESGDCWPRQLQDEVVVDEVENQLCDHLKRLGLGPPLLPRLSVNDVLKRVVVSRRGVRLVGSEVQSLENIVQTIGEEL
jgi:hypothetical protein